MTEQKIEQKTEQKNEKTYYVSKYLRNPDNKIVITEERFCFTEPITLKLKEKIFSLSGDSFSIKDLNGVEYFKCSGRAFSIKEKKVLLDLYDQPILNIKEKVISLRGKMKIYEGNSSQDVLMTIKPKSPIFNEKFTVNFHNKFTGKDEVFEMRCDFTGFNCEIYYGKKKEGAPMIARVIKKVDAKLILTSQENYYVEVAAGVDAAAIIALAICFDEGKNDSSSGIGIGLDILDIFT
ncbi:hypothetical protein PIROE2DRAFT_60910 [Piromyces sp. E2]|nr:hypothetical protein PIROE2DRAFT_60910 [Piromyces sp. E2]|eukprot:OUM64086.1 hypothetical protein PIROE2DRAFT_60910 [Piromyces sp. E2]